MLGVELEEEFPIWSKFVEVWHVITQWPVLINWYSPWVLCDSTRGSCWWTFGMDDRVTEGKVGGEKLPKNRTDFLVPLLKDFLKIQIAQLWIAMKQDNVEETFFSHLRWRGKFRLPLSNLPARIQGALQHNGRLSPWDLQQCWRDSESATLPKAHGRVSWDALAARKIAHGGRCNIVPMWRVWF